MNIMAIEDEELLLDALELAVRTAEPQADIRLFHNAEDALAWPDANRSDIAFVDVKLPGMSGTELARRLLDFNPHMNIVFVTSFSAYMKDALDMHASGYIAKPVTAEKVRRELDFLRFPITAGNNEAEEPRLRVRCFGSFEAFVDGEPLACRSSRAIELLAYLVDRRGARCSIGEIEAVLWGARPKTPSRQSHLRNLLAELNRSLNEAGLHDVILRQYGFVALNTSCISCDYWDYLDNKPGTAGSFHGEYMSQYSWAERTLANLLDF